MRGQTTDDDQGATAERPRCFAVRHRRIILLITAIVVPVTAAVGVNVADSLSVGGFVTSASEYEVGRRVLTEQLHGGTPNFVVLVKVNGAQPRTGAVDADE